MNPMKKLSLLMLCLIAFAATPAVSQEKSPPAPQPPPPALTRFDLDFPGGSPGELVAAIQKAMGHPLNAVVSAERADLKMPAIKLKGINVAELFRALEEASRVNQQSFPGPATSYGFRSQYPPTDNSIWYFFFEGPPPTQRNSGVYLLTPYLEQGLTVDDITTAIQTAWKMLGYTTTPQLSFHKETKLLIAVGEFQQLGTIDEVLHALRAPKPTPATKPEPQKTKE
jgi:hypothetical protein